MPERVFQQGKTMQDLEAERAESAALVAPILATGMNDYVAELPEPLAGPTLITFEKSNTRSATLLVGKNKKPIHTVVNGRMAELPPGTISPRNTYSLTETADAYVLDPDYDIVVEEEPVKFHKEREGSVSSPFPLLSFSSETQNCHPRTPPKENPLKSAS